MSVRTVLSTAVDASVSDNSQSVSLNANKKGLPNF